MELTLADGRILAFEEYGDPDGAALIYLHGAGACGLDARPLDAAAREHGIRVIAPDRSGVGRSSEDPGITVLGYADDLRQLADQLGLGQLVVSGQSNGGMLAMGAAFALPDRVISAIPINSASPIADRAVMRSLPALTRMSYSLMRFLPTSYVARSSERSWAAGPQHGPDKELMEIPELRQLFTEIGTTPKSLDYLSRELRMTRQPWGFDHRAVKQPVEVFTGDHDAGVAYARIWASELADARLHEFRGGHSGHVRPEVAASIVEAAALAHR